MLFAHQRVSGILDWGATRIDLPWTDVARLLGSLASDDHQLWELGLSAYTDPQPVTSDMRQVVRALDVSGVVLGAANWVRWLAVEQRHFSQPASIGPRLDALAGRLDHLLRFSG